jgi:hypothetical protein
MGPVPVQNGLQNGTKSALGTNSIAMSWHKLFHYKKLQPGGDRHYKSFVWRRAPTTELRPSCHVRRPLGSTASPSFRWSCHVQRPLGSTALSSFRWSCHVSRPLGAYRNL